MTRSVFITITDLKVHSVSKVVPRLQTREQVRLILMSNVHLEERPQSEFRDPQVQPAPIHLTLAEALSLVRDIQDALAEHHREAEQEQE